MYHLLQVITSFTNKTFHPSHTTLLPQQVIPKSFLTCNLFRHENKHFFSHQQFVFYGLKLTVCICLCDSNCYWIVLICLTDLSKRLCAGETLDSTESYWHVVGEDDEEEEVAQSSSPPLHHHSRRLMLGSLYLGVLHKNCSVLRHSSLLFRSSDIHLDCF